MRFAVITPNGDPITFLNAYDAELVSEEEAPELFGPFDFSKGCPKCGVQETETDGPVLKYVSYTPDVRHISDLTTTPVVVSGEGDYDYEGTRDTRIECSACLAVFPVQDEIDVTFQ